MYWTHTVVLCAGLDEWRASREITDFGSSRLGALGVKRNVC